MPRICFIHQKAMGHAVEARLLRRYVEGDDGVQGVFYDVSFQNERINKSMGFQVPVLNGRDLDLYSYRSHLAGSMEVEGYLRTAGRFDAIYSQTHNVAYKIRGSTPLTVVIDAPNLTLARWGWNARLPYTRVTWRPSISQERNVIGRAKAVIVRSEWSKKIIMDEYGTEDGKVSVVPSPIAIPDIQKEREAGGKLRLLFVGADFERKGGHTLLEAFAHGLKERCELDIVTRSDVQPTLEVRVHKDITDAELDGLYRRADIFVFPTVHEPYGRVVAEAMAYGLPVVASDVAAIPEILSGGECGELVPPGDAAALARAVSGLAGDEVARKTLGLKAREKAIREYDTDKVCARVLDIVKSTVG